MRARLLALILPAVLVTSVASASGPAFTPRLLAGRWVGTAVQYEGGETLGSASIRIRALSGGRMSFVLHYRNKSGCHDIDHSSTLTRGYGANHWNKRGFVISQDGVDATYSHARRLLRFRTTNLFGCRDFGSVLTVQGKFTRSVFKGTLYFQPSYTLLVQLTRS